eukprot:113605-Chlamydomonas_euryale.AAC.1
MTVARQSVGIRTIEIRTAGVQTVGNKMWVCKPCGVAGGVATKRWTCCKSGWLVHVVADAAVVAAAVVLVAVVMVVGGEGGAWRLSGGGVWGLRRSREGTVWACRPPH